MSAPSLDGRSFALVTSTASAVDQREPTRFTYHEQDGLVWCEYAGGVAVTGRAVGERRGDRLHLRFAHLLLGGASPVVGAVEAGIEVAEDGRVRLVEDFDQGDVPHRSISIEVRPGD